MTVPDAQLLTVVTLCKQAGLAAMAHYVDPERFEKADGSPLTAADLAANRVLITGLPAIDLAPILSEESAHAPWSERQAWTRLWLVDPIDGTKEFLKRNDQFTVNVALVEDGVPVLGVVHAPALAVTYLARVGHGAWVERDGGLTAIGRAGDPDDGLEVVGSRSHRSPELERFMAGLGPHRELTMGSSLKFCVVAEGRAHLYPRIGPTMEWDTAAAHAVAAATGCRVTDLTGEPLRYNKPDLLNPHFVVDGTDSAGWRRAAGSGSAQS